MAMATAQQHTVLPHIGGKGDMSSVPAAAQLDMRSLQARHAPLSRVSACAARTINVTGQPRAALVAAVGALQSGLWPLPGGKEPHTRNPKRSLQRMRVKIGNRMTREFPLFLLILQGIF